MQVIWLCVRFMREEKLRKLREECQPKVIFLDANTPPTETDSTLYLFDHEGEVIKVRHVGRKKERGPALLSFVPCLSV